MGSGGQGVGQEGPRDSRGRPMGSEGVKKSAYRVPRGQGLDLQGHRGGRGRPARSQVGLMDFLMI